MKRSLIGVPVAVIALLSLFLVSGISDMLVRGVATCLLVMAAVFMGMVLEGRPREES